MHTHQQLLFKLSAFICIEGEENRKVIKLLAELC